MKKFVVAALLSAPAFAFAGGANQLIAVPAATKGASVISLDFVAAGDTAGFQFTLDVGVQSDKQVNLSKCVSSIPKNRAGSCGFKDGRVIGVVYSPDGTAIPAGVINVGSVAVSGSSAALKILSVQAFDVAGNDVAATVTSAEK